MPLFRKINLDSNLTFLTCIIFKKFKPKPLCSFVNYLHATGRLKAQLDQYRTENLAIRSKKDNLKKNELFKFS